MGSECPGRGLMPRSTGVDQRGAAGGAALRSALRALVCSAVLVLAVSAVGCGGDDGAARNGGDSNSGTPASGPKGELTIGVNTDYGSLDPAKDASVTGTQAARALTHAPLIHVNPDGTFTGGGPALAESFGYVGEGNRAFEIKLREGAEFSDGAPVDAAAVKTWLEYFAKSAGPYASQLSFREIETPDDLTVVLKFKSPTTSVPWLLSEILNWGSVSSPKAVAKPKTLGTQTAGAGPYVLDRSASVTGDHYTLVPNDRYWDQDQIRYSKITVKVITNPTTMLQAARTGEVDVAVGAANTAESAKSAGLTVVSDPSGWKALALTDRKGEIVEALGDVRVRRALNYAVDRQGIADGIMRGSATPGSAPRTPDGFDPELANYYPYDPDKARSLLAEAGYADGFELELLDSAFAPPDGDIAQAIAKNFEEIGIKVKVTSTSDVNEYIEKATSGDYAVVEVGSAINPMSFLYNLVGKPKTLFNPLSLKDPELDRLMKEGSVAEDPTPAFQEMTRLMTEQAYFVVNTYVLGLWYVSDDVGGVEFTAESYAPFATEWFPK